MTEKKEVLDYLRNKQKAAEIEAKVNGINLWVLLGAIAIVAWQLLGTLDSPVWSQEVLILRTLVIVQAIYLANWTARPSIGIRDDVRYLSSRDINVPFIYLFESLLLLFPSALFLLRVERSLTAGFLCLFGVMMSAFVITKIISKCFRKQIAVEKKFPEPHFRITTKSSLISDAILIVLFVIVIVDHGWRLYTQAGSISVESTKTLALIATLYLLLLIATHRRLSSHADQWIDELETDLVLNVISPDAALRRIENRALGPRMKDVMDNFLDDVEKRFSELTSKLERCLEALATVSEVPTNFQVERAARIQGAAEDSKRHIEALSKDIEEFQNYILRLSDQNNNSPRAELTTLLESLKSRGTVYKERVTQASTKLKSMIGHAESETSLAMQKS